MTFDENTPQRPTTLQDAVITLDKDILRLLARRSNLLHKLCAHGQQHIDAQTEKALRAAWEKYAARMSNDPRLTQQLFSLMQEIEFLPKPRDGEERRPAFNLAPVRQAVDVRLTTPLVSRRARLFLTLAAVSGSACRISPSLLSDSDVEFIKMFNQLATSLAWEDGGTLLARQGGGLTLADKVVFVGNDPLNFFLVLGQYVGHPSHAKFSGDSALKLYNMQAVRKFLPQLGARLTNVVPKTDGLPVRVECSGMVPDTVTIPADLPADAVLGLILGLPFWQSSVTLDMSAHADAAHILEEAGDILRQCGTDMDIQGTTLRVTPGSITTPAEPKLGMDLTLAAYLLALPGVAGGTVRLDGQWATCTVGDGLRALLSAVSNCTHQPDCVRTQADGELPPLALSSPLDARALPVRFAPLAVALSAVSALRNGAAPMPLLPDAADSGEITSFLTHVGLQCTDDGRLTPDAHNTFAGHDDLGWTAPSPTWALALALTAYARPGLKLANPAIVSALYPSFWSLYNALPCPELKQTVTEPSHAKPVKRRIIAADADGIGSGNSDS